jgi:hypothetical protein
MLLAGIATRTFCATASAVQNKPSQKKATRRNPRRKYDARFVLTSFFMALLLAERFCFVTALQTGGVYVNRKFLSIEILCRKI